jgi:hypothetical protein
MSEKTLLKVVSHLVLFLSYIATGVAQLNHVGAGRVVVGKNILVSVDKPILLMSSRFWQSMLHQRTGFLVVQ